MTGDWGLDAVPMPSSWPDTALRADELPDVLAARDAGWSLAPDAPMWAFLPAVWPSTHRCWLPDRSVRWTTVSCSGRPSVDVPWSAWDHVEHERDVNELLVASSVPPRPFGRLWLLRAPDASSDLDAAIDDLAGSAARAGLVLRCDHDFVAFAATVVAGWFGHRDREARYAVDAGPRTSLGCRR